MGPRKQFIYGVCCAFFLCSMCAQAADVFLVRGDFDGDGQEEMPRVDEQGQVRINLSTGRLARWGLHGADTAVLQASQLSALLAGDFDGDGQDDLRGLKKDSAWCLTWSVGRSYPAQAFQLASSGGQTLLVDTFAHTLAADFDGDGRDELCALQTGADQAFFWGQQGAPENQITLRNTAQATVPVDQLPFVLAGDFAGLGYAQLRGLQGAGAAWNYIWDMQGECLFSLGLRDTQGNPVYTGDLRYPLAADFDGDGLDELRALRAGQNLDYVWKAQAQPFFEGELLNATGDPVPVNSLTEVFAMQTELSSTPLLAAIQGENAWYYLWPLAATPAEDGPVTNANDVADLRMETPWRTPEEDPGRPLVVANYFLSFTGDAAPLGQPAVFRPGTLAHQIGAWNDPALQDYWETPGGQTGFLSYGPYVTVTQIRTALAMANGGDVGRAIFRIQYELMTDSTAFSDQPLGLVDVLATGADSQTRTLYRHELYPQDFLQADAFEWFSFDMADYVPQEDEQLEFRVWASAAGALAVRGVRVMPMEFESIFGGWTNVPWQGGLETGEVWRLFDPNWRLSSDLHKDGSLTPLASLDPWRRDIAVGHAGFYPYIGPYSQADAQLLRYQIRQAKAAGLDGFKVYIYYATRAGDTDIESTYWAWNSFQSMLETAAQEDFGLFLDDSMLERVGATDYTYEDAVANLGFVARRGFLDHPGYLKRNGRPLYGLPVTHQSDPQALADFIADLNDRYHTATGHTQALFTLVTAMTTWGEQTNPTGPYNMQEAFLSEGSYLWTDWTRYFACAPAPASLADLLGRGTLKYDTSEPVSGYGMLLATLLERDELSAWRSVDGVSSLFDWAAPGAMLWPQYFLYGDGQWTLSGTPDTTTMLEAFKVYTRDAHAHHYGAVITLSPGHDKSNLWRDVEYELIPRTETGAGTLRWRRMLASALAAAPDIIAIENWNGYGEAVQIEPCEGFLNDQGQSDPDIYLKLLAEALGQTYQAPFIPASIVDPLRLEFIPAQRLEGNSHNDTRALQWNAYH